jgi:hypothetical protein
MMYMYIHIYICIMCVYIHTYIEAVKDVSFTYVLCMFAYIYIHLYICIHMQVVAVKDADGEARLMVFLNQVQ